MTHLKVGEQAPEFTFVDNNGKQIALSTYRGKKVALYFYPKDMTPGCTNQACNLRDHYKELTNKGIEIIGVSQDDNTRHQKFKDKYDLPFTLISDETKKIIQQYGVWGPKKFMGKTYDGIHRTTFLINEEGIIHHIILKPKTKIHASEILKEFE